MTVILLRYQALVMALYTDHPVESVYPNVMLLLLKSKVKPYLIARYDWTWFLSPVVRDPW